MLITPTNALASDCLQVNGFTVHKAYDFGIYVQCSASIEINDVLLVDNGVGVFPFVIGPGILSHVVANKVML